MLTATNDRYSGVLKKSPTTSKYRAVSSTCGICADSANVTHLTLGKCLKNGAMVKSCAPSYRPLMSSVTAWILWISLTMDQSLSGPTTVKSLGPFLQ